MSTWQGKTYLLTVLEFFRHTVHKEKNNLKHLWQCSEDIIEKWPKKKRWNNFKDQSLTAHLYKDCEHFAVGHFWAPFVGAPNEQVEN